MAVCAFFLICSAATSSSYLQGVDDNATVFKLPCGTPIIEQIREELATLPFPQGTYNNNNNEEEEQLRVKIIISNIQERLDISSSIGKKFWKM